MSELSWAKLKSVAWESLLGVGGHHPIPPPLWKWVSECQKTFYLPGFTLRSGISPLLEKSTWLCPSMASYAQEKIVTLELRGEAIFSGNKESECLHLVGLPEQNRPSGLNNYNLFSHSSGGWASQVAQTVKNLPVMWETQVRSLGLEDPLEKAMATHSSILAWRIPWTEEAGGLQPMGSQRVRHNWAINSTTGGWKSKIKVLAVWCLVRELSPWVVGDCLLGWPLTDLS